MLRIIAWLLALLLWGLAPAPAYCGDGDAELTELKVAYIYNFTRFVQWPAPEAPRPFVIGVIGDGEMEAGLRTLENGGKQANGGPIQIRGFQSPEVITPCDILFVGAAMEQRLPDILQRTAGLPTLLLADTPGFARQGVTIEFFLKRDILRKKDLLRFRINPQALDGRGLTISAQLYDVGEILQ